MERYELVEGSAAKFWEVGVSGPTLTVRFGRLGTQGQSKDKTCADAAAAVKEKDKLVREKTAKGYVRADGAAPAPAPAPAAARKPGAARASGPAAETVAGTVVETAAEGAVEPAVAPPAESPPAPAAQAEEPQAYPMPTIGSVFAHEDLLERDARVAEDAPFDLTREPMSFPAGRDQRLQALARGDEGFLLSLAYSSQRGWGSTHPLCGEIRLGQVEVEFVPEELGFAIEFGEVTVTECQMLSGFSGSADRAPQYTRGYGLTFGHCERKAMSMAIVDRALRHREVGEQADAPVQDEEFVLYHSDNVEASGFVQHLKLPHYVDFQADLQLIRRLRREHFERLNPIKEAAE